MNIKALVLNYNLADVADQLYEKLVYDGFDKNNIISVDNGSDKNKPSKYANLILPFNIRLPGQVKVALNYLADYFPADYYLLVTTSVSLSDDVNYYNIVNDVLKELEGEDISCIAPSLKGDEVKYSNAKNIQHDLISSKFVHDFHFQPVMLLISHKFLNYMRKREFGYYNSKLFRGWGLDYEIQFYSNLKGYKCLVSRDMWCNWNINLTHKKNMADEDRASYQDKAWNEADSYFSKKFTKFWDHLFYLTYRLSTKFSKYPSNISPRYDLKKILKRKFK